MELLVKEFSDTKSKPISVSTTIYENGPSEDYFEYYGVASQSKDGKTMFLGTQLMRRSVIIYGWK